MTRSMPPLQTLAFPASAVGLAAVVALAISVAPAALLEGFVTGSGLASLVPAAEPPLGAKARALLAFVGGAGAALAYLAGYLILEHRARAARIRARSAAIVGAPMLRRGDAHPDHPPRRPIFAAEDLGFVHDEEVAERIVPAGGETIGDLLARFENGLQRRRAAG